MYYRIVFFVFLAFSAPTQAQEHRGHPVADLPLHEKFYSSWRMPDQPTRSCCNMADCYPTEVRIQGDLIYARRREDGKWLRIPSHKVERHRDNPTAAIIYVRRRPPHHTRLIPCSALHLVEAYDPLWTKWYRQNHDVMSACGARSGDLKPSAECPLLGGRLNRSTIPILNRRDRDYVLMSEKCRQGLIAAEKPEFGTAGSRES